MFRKTNKKPTIDIFGDYDRVYTNSSYAEKLFAPTAWHNIFYENVYQMIDEALFAPLYSDAMGAPNASIATLVSMSAIKESFNLSDKMLFDQFRYHTQFRMAIGIRNLNDKIPSETAYYDFRRKLTRYEVSNKQSSLMDICFQKTTRKQAIKFNVSGKKIRMDSKLIGSQISWDSRYVLIHKTLYTFWRALSASEKQKAHPEDQSYLALLFKEKADHITYTETPEELHQRLVHLGEIIHRFLSLYSPNSHKHYALLPRLFEEQYTASDPAIITLLPKQKIAAKSLQSPHDPDSTYRKKGDKQSKGYVVNVTETCGDDELHLITSVQCAPNVTPDNSFVQSSIETSESVLETDVEQVIADGAYHSVENDEYAENNPDLDIIYTGFQGREPRFELIEEKEQLMAKDSQSGQIYHCYLVRKNKRSKEESKRWYCLVEGKRYYFSESAVEAARQRAKLAKRSKEELQRRNNVEATMFLFGWGLWKNKIRYRGLVRASIWSFARALAINFKRIVGYMCPKPAEIG